MTLCTVGIERTRAPSSRVLYITLTVAAPITKLVISYKDVNFDNLHEYYAYPTVQVRAPKILFILRVMHIVTLSIRLQLPTKPS